MADILLKSRKIGIIGAGNMAQAMISAFIESQTLAADQIFVSNRTTGKLEKLKKRWGVNTFLNNEEVIEKVDIVILAVKPQDLVEAMEPVASLFHESQVIISLAAGFSLDSLGRLFPNVKSIFRLMANTAVGIREGTMAYCHTREAQHYIHTIEALFDSLGQVFAVPEGETFEAFTVGTSSAVGFILELMMYWKDWLQDHDVDEALAKEMVIQTFKGSSLLAEKKHHKNLEELRDKVVSKKGVTAAGLSSFRELELERILRISFGKAVARDKELSQS